MSPVAKNFLSRCSKLFAKVARPHIVLDCVLDISRLNQFRVPSVTVRGLLLSKSDWTFAVAKITEYICGECTTTTTIAGLVGFLELAGWLAGSLTG